ncbi:MAG: glycosyltransferase family 4 protein [Firmicutes bacterium]|nr:glycosyltransferase family 4 protein [Bacillota bacterium]
MRILHVTNDMEVGGVQVYLSHLLPALRSRGHEVSLVVLTGHGQLLEALEAASIPWHYIPSIIRRGAMKFPRKASVKELQDFMQYEFMPDIVHSHLLIGNTVGRLAAIRLPRRPGVIATEHSTYYHKPGWAQYVDRRLARRTDAIMAVSNAVRDFTISQERLSAEKLVTIRLGLIPQKVTAGPDDALYEELRRRPTVAIVGRLTDEKGHRLFLKTLAAVLAEDPEVLGLVIGDGPLRAELEELAQQLWLGPDNVKFLGMRRDIAALTKRFDVFLLPSRREGFGMAPLEAMAGGATVVLSRIPAFEELTEHGRMGKLVALDGRISVWKQAVLEALDSPLDRNSLRQFVSEHYAFDRHVDRLLDLYQRILGDKGVELA